MNDIKCFVSITKYKNLPQECLVLVNTFFPELRCVLFEESTSEVVVKIFEDHFLIRVFQREISDHLVEDFRRQIKISLFEMLVQETNYRPSWGILQGIRPTKLVFKLMEEFEIAELANQEERIVEALKSRYLLSDKMAKLTVNVAQNEENYIPLNKGLKEGGFSIYIGIPFCPTKCLYCSFTSNSITHWKAKMDTYLYALLKEWDEVVKPLLRKYELSTIYIGGGTPTSLESAELEQLLEHINKDVVIKTLKEVTVEAGRPDTITFEKLEVLKKYGVQRISINPQTMHQKTLDIIGRNHSVEDIYKAYEIATNLGFKRINMDIIIGLPNEKIEDLEETLRAIERLNPQEVTVHTLAVKRSSKLHEHLSEYELPSLQVTEEMLAKSKEVLLRLGHQPYYLYRQKNMVGSHENVGYYRGKVPCIYNIEIMEEVRTIVALGAGSVTKVVAEDGSIKRIENVKNVTEYIHRIDEMIKRKKGIDIKEKKS